MVASLGLTKDSRLSFPPSPCPNAAPVPVACGPAIDIVVVVITVSIKMTEMTDDVDNHTPTMRLMLIKTKLML